MSSISFNSVVRANDTEKQSLNNAKKDDLQDNVIHVGEDGKVNKEDLLGALKDGNKEVFIKKPDGTLYKANVEKELGKLNEELGKNQDLCIDFCVTDTKTETKELPPNIEDANKFKFKLSDGKDTKKELKEMGVNVKDGLDKKEVETIVNKLRAEGATQPEIDNFLKDVNKLRGMKKNDQKLDIKTGENKVEYSVEDKTVKKGDREKVRDFEFKLPTVNVEKVRKGEIELPSVNVEKVRKGELKLPSVNVEKEGNFKVQLPKLGVNKEIKKLEDKLDTYKELKSENPVSTECDDAKTINNNLDNKITETEKKIEELKSQKKLKVELPKFKVEGEPGKLQLPKFKVDVEPGKLQLPKFKVEGEPGKVQLPKFKVDVEPGKLQLPKYERPLIKEEGFKGSVQTKEEITTTTTECDTIGVDKTPEKPEDFDVKGNQKYDPNYVVNPESPFSKEDGKNVLKAISAGASIEIKCYGDRIYQGKAPDQKQRFSDLDYSKDLNALTIGSAASTDRGLDIKYDNMDFKSIGDKGKTLQTYIASEKGKVSNKETYPEGTNDGLSVFRGLEMGKDMIQAALNEYPGTLDEFLKDFGNKEIKLTSGNENVGMPPGLESLTVKDFVSLYGIEKK